MRVLIIDNYDSFTFNLFHYIQYFVSHVDVVKNDKVSLQLIDNYDKIVLSPGPGLPHEHKNLHEILERYSNSKSFLGVCLGHQAIGEYFGANLKQLSIVRHGVSSKICIDSDLCFFKNIPNYINVGHYHSWVIDDKYIPDCLEITSRNVDTMITSIRHKNLDIRGVQFHPESILTEYGINIIENWIKL
ncbi:MAG: aminodeoxychorismate/anthranilate synthase component II [Bacteroidota bacterium]|nr:aminodeoxychorismate/anthranilate synthase component II [Bacteroidota bacterium]